jgi:hypothetical protein
MRIGKDSPSNICRSLADSPISAVCAGYFHAAWVKTPPLGESKLGLRLMTIDAGKPVVSLLATIGKNTVDSAARYQGAIDDFSGRGAPFNAWIAEVDRCARSAGAGAVDRPHRSTPHQAALRLALRGMLLASIDRSEVKFD